MLGPAFYRCQDSSNQFDNRDNLSSRLHRFCRSHDHRRIPLGPCQTQVGSWLMCEQVMADKGSFALCSEEAVDFGSKDLQLRQMVG